jgi:ceramide glucosyltransferase
MGYSVQAILAARKYLSTPRANLHSIEPVSILKPLAGLDPGLESNLRTFFAQEYQAFEILFAVRSEDDPALEVVRKLQAEFPRVRSRVFITGEPPWANAKVFSLQTMLAEAANDLVVMSDSDIRVTPQLLTRVAAEFQDRSVGVATCPYRAVAGKSVWSRMEATGMNTVFISGILVARMLEGMQFAVGPTIVARRSVLESIGGFERLKDYLAEDFVMGKFAADAGHGVILSSYVVEHHIGSSDFRHNASHRLRWARSTRRSRPLGYLGQIFTMPLPLGLLAWADNPAWWPLALLGAAASFAVAWTMSRRILNVRLEWALVPLQDIAEFLFWIAGFFGNKIWWRGRRYRLYPDGRFELLVE